MTVPDHTEPIVTEVQDLTGHTLATILTTPAGALAHTTAHVVERVSQPGRSISGYNPQRLDG